MSSNGQRNSHKCPVRYFCRIRSRQSDSRQDRKPEINKAIHDAIASRIASIIRRIGVNEDIVMVGGVGYNPGFISAMKRELKVDTIYIPDDPEYGAAVGAAILAAEGA